MITPQAILIHVPRCGGSALESFFGDATGGHHRWNWYQETLPEAWANRWKIALVRAPLARAWSLFQSWSRPTIDSPEARRAQMRFTAECPDFPTMVGKLPWLIGQSWTEGHFQPQTKFLCQEIAHPATGQITLRLTVDAVFRLEDLTRDWMWLRNRAGGGPGALPRLHATESAIPWLSPETRAALRQIYEPDYVLLGYP